MMSKLILSLTLLASVCHASGGATKKPRRKSSRTQIPDKINKDDRVIYKGDIWTVKEICGSRASLVSSDSQIRKKNIKFQSLTPLSPHDEQLFKQQQWSHSISSWEHERWNSKFRKDLDEAAVKYARIAKQCNIKEWINSKPSYSFGLKNLFPAMKFLYKISQSKNIDKQTKIKSIALIKDIGKLLKKTREASKYGYANIKDRNWNSYMKQRITSDHRHHKIEVQEMSKHLKKYFHEIGDFTLADAFKDATSLFDKFSGGCPTCYDEREASGWEDLQSATSKFAGIQAY